MRQRWMLVFSAIVLVLVGSLQAQLIPQAYRVTGKFALALQTQGIRKISGHFGELQGSVRVPTGQFHSHGRGEVYIRMDSWRGRDAQAEHPVRALAGAVEEPYATLNVEAITGITEALRRPGGVQTGTLVGSIAYDGHVEYVNVPVHIFSQNTRYLTVQSIRPLLLSRQELGLQSPQRGFGEAYDDDLRGFFRLQLTAQD